MNNSNWNEAEHPRDEDGKFTFKGLGLSKKESDEEKMQRRADILYPTMNNKKETFTGGAAKIVTDEIAGVKKGEQMNIEDAISDVNPDFQVLGNQTYTTNCQAAVAVAEARIRGFNVEVSIPYSSDFKDKLSENPNIAYIDPKTGKVPNFTINKVSNEFECEKWLNENIKQGERYLFAFQWKQRNINNETNEHIIILVKNKNDELKYYDPQSNFEYDKTLLNRIRYNKIFYPRILRIDDKELNYKIMNQISKPARNKQFEINHNRKHAF